MSESTGKTVGAGSRARSLRQARAKRIARRFAIVVGLPTLLAVIFYCFLVQERYRSIVLFRVVDADVPLEDKAPPEINHYQILRELIHSETMVEQLRADELLEHFTQAGDWFSRLTPNAGVDETAAYYRDKVAVVPPSAAGSIRLEVISFSPKAAQTLAAHIIGHAEALWAERVRGDLTRRMASAESLVAAAKRRAAAARQALRSLQEAGAEPTSDAFGEAQVEYKVAQEAYQTAKLAAAAARLAHDAQTVKELEILGGPTLPSSHFYPRRIWGILRVFFVAAALMTVVGLLAGAVREHAKF